MSQKVYVPLTIDAFTSVNFKTFSEAMPLLPSHGKAKYPRTPKSLKLILCTDPRPLWHRAAVWMARNDQVLRKREVPASSPSFQTLIWMPHAFISAYMTRATWNYKMVRLHRRKKKKERKISLGIFRAFSFLKKLSSQNKSSQERGGYLKAEFGGTGELVQQLTPKFFFRYPHQADSNGPSLYLQRDLTPSGHLSTWSPMQIFLILHFTSISSHSDPNSLGNSEK